MSQQKIVIIIEYKDQCYEIYDYPKDLNKFKESIKQIIKPPGEIQLSWRRDPNSDLVNIVSFNNLQRCIDYQINSIKNSPSEYLIKITATDEQLQSIQSQDPFGISKPVERDLSKSTQFQYHIGQKLNNQSQDQQQQQQSNNNNVPESSISEYDRSKYTDYNCYNCGGDSVAQQYMDQKCSVCQGVGKLLKSKEISTIEYLIEKKLCELYPELKQIYKQQPLNNSPEIIQSSQNQPNISMIPQSSSNNNNIINNNNNLNNNNNINSNINFETNSYNPSSSSNNNNNNIVSNNQNNNISGSNSNENPKPSNNKKDGKKNKFQKLFSNALINKDDNQNNAAQQTPSENIEMNKQQETNKGDNSNNNNNNNKRNQLVSSDNNINLLKGSDEICSFDVFKHPSDKNEIIFKSNEEKIIDFQLKRKSKQWPQALIYVEEQDEKYFENLSVKTEYDFSQNQEVQNIQLILKPSHNFSSPQVVSKWKLFYYDANNNKKNINGVIPLKATIQSD